VRRFRAGAPHALDLLIERYVARAMGVAREYASSLDDAEDLVQEAFQRAVRALPRFDARQRFAPWFFTILRNIGRNAVRGAAQRESLDAADGVASPEQSMADASDTELRRHIERELAAMPASQAACFRLCQIEGFSAQEVGDMMGLAPPTVRTHAHRARLKLRDALTRLGYEAPE
jgi:RNA polymerase sigma-70 factor (ECF subfamily)